MNQPIRVAMIIQGYHPRVGGAERQLAALAPLLKARQVEVHVITRQYPGLARFEMIDDVPVYRVPIPGPKAMATLSFVSLAQPRLQRLRPHLIHAHELLSPTTAALVAKHWLNIPVVAKVLRGGNLGDLRKLKRKSFGWQRIARIQQNVDAFIAISSEIDEELAEIGVEPGRRLFIPNGVDLDRFSPLPPMQRQRLRSTLQLPDGLITIFTGRLVKEKRLDYLISLWPAIRSQYADAALVIIGTGEAEAALKQQAGNGVMFIGQVGDVAPYLKAADLFVLPSATEGLSNAMLEAMATGLPTIATRVGGAPDVIDHATSGWLVPPDDQPSLQEALLMLLGNAALRSDLGQRGHEKILRDYALNFTADGLRALYDQLTHKSPIPVLPANNPDHAMKRRCGEAKMR